MKIIIRFLITCGLLVLSACSAVQGEVLTPNKPAISQGSSTANQPGTLKTSPAKTPQFIEFYSPLWSTCREVLPIVNGLEKDYAGRINFLRINIHNPKNKILMDTYGVTSTPELYLVNGQGRVIGSWDGSVTQEDLRRAFDRVLGHAGN